VDDQLAECRLVGSVPFAGDVVAVRVVVDTFAAADFHE
jgi:hypothetical protein